VDFVLWTGCRASRDGPILSYPLPPSACSNKGVLVPIPVRPRHTQFSGGCTVADWRSKAHGRVAACRPPRSDRAPDAFGVSESVLGHLICIRLKDWNGTSSHRTRKMATTSPPPLLGFHDNNDSGTFRRNGNWRTSYGVVVDAGQVFSLIK